MPDHDTDTQGASGQHAAPPEGAGAAGDAGANGGTQPEGFVPLADFEREQVRSRAFQSELDRTKQELAAARAATAATATGASDDGEGFDPAAYRRELLRDVVNVSRMAASVDTLKTKYPHADPALYARMDEFASAEAFALAVSDSHDRVASIVASQVDRGAVEAEIRAEYAAKYGEQGDPAGAPTPTGDPTPEQLAALSASELNALEAKNPGVLDRVLRSAI